MLTYWCERAWLPSGVAERVLVECEDGVIVRVASDSDPQGIELSNVVLPGLANVHSHAFQRALRGRTHTSGDFWTWRNAMYALAARLEPDTYHALARAVYAEMALAGVTCVGEFHYVHHRPDGSLYDDANAMGEALCDAARDAGIRMTLIDACYLAGGIGEPLAPAQRRFGDADVATWSERVAALKADANTRIAVAAHSLRAVSLHDLAAVVAAADGRPFHIHLSEQPAENESCLDTYGKTPATLLAEHGGLGPMTTVIHATHLSDADIRMLGESGVGACFCPTTERDLADGIGPARVLADNGVALCLGSDQHAVIDLLAEGQALELNERLLSGRRGNFTPTELVEMLTGHARLGWPEAGRIEVGAICDLVAIRDDTVRTAGADPAQLPLVASADDIADVVAGGAMVVHNGVHQSIPDVAGALAEAIAAVS
ncbi:MAG TPA: formimidoylglutamate deiminase [Gaiellaceae bacterium]|jgi:formiminoglutamate deiminase